MPSASLLLLVAALSGAPSSDTVGAINPGAIGAPKPGGPYLSAAAAQSVARRRLGFGASIVGGNYGAGGSVRYWMTELFGMDASGFWYRGRRFERSGGSLERTSAVLFSVSGLALLSPHDARKEIDLRPIVGAGTNYIRSSQFVVNGETTTANPRGWGWHALGGVEAAFIQGFAVTGALAYYRLPGDFRDAGLFDGFNLVVSVHAYF